MKTSRSWAYAGRLGFPVATAGRNRSPTRKIEQRCIIQFRRDTLESVPPVPIGPDTDNINGSEVTISGTLKRVQADVILITTDKAEYLIPIPAILCLKFELPTPAK